MVTRFLVAFSKVMPGRGVMAGRPLLDKPQEVVFWHNYRSGQRLDAESGILAEIYEDEKTYMALRLQSVCYVIRKSTGQIFDHKRVAQALLAWGGKTMDAVPSHTSQFALCNNWPLCKMAGDVGQYYKVALEEDEIRGDELLSSPECTAMLISEEKFQRVMNENENGALVDDSYKEIMINIYTRIRSI